MKPILKILSIVVLLTCFVYFICFSFRENFLVQACYFVVVNLAFIYTKGLKVYWGLIKYWYRLSAIILILYLLFWNINDGINAILLLINTVLSIELIIFILTINDILSLPISVKHLKFIILARALFIQTTARFDNDAILINTIPEFQLPQTSVMKKIEMFFYKNIILTMTFVFYILEQSTIIGELIDNRLNHTKND